MNLSVLVIAGAVVLAGVVLMGGFLYERYKSSPNYYERTRSPRYDTLMRDHRTGFIWTTTAAVTLAVIALVDWSSYDFRREWPTSAAHATAVNTHVTTNRRGRVLGYHTTVAYSYSVEGNSYAGVSDFVYGDEASNQQRAASFQGGETIIIWYHPIMPGLHLTIPVTAIYDIIILCIAGFVGIGSLSSLVGMIRLKLTDGY